MKRIRPLLSWKLNDYQKNDIEPPEILLEKTEKTEGELFSENELKEWFNDSFKTLTVLKGDDEELFRELRDIFILDLQYLCKIDKIDENVLDELLEDELLR